MPVAVSGLPKLSKMDRGVIVQLSGGLGNQLFQYAAGRCLAQQRNTSLSFDLTRLDQPSQGVTPRKYALGPFQPKANVLSNEQVSQIEKANMPTFWNRFTSKLGLNKNQYSYYSEPKPYTFEKAFLDLPANSYLLNSYFQHLGYVQPAEELLRKELSAILSPPSSTITVGIHVRRGDYVHLPSAAGFHGTCGVDYYKRAIELFSAQLNTSAHFIFFSDEPDWVSENMPLPTNYSFASNASDFEDFTQLSNCSHQIIANSSFSWWAAWLNPNPNKIVIAPSKWVNDDSIDTTGLFPSNWTLL